jgi:hypothetical protein
MERAGLFEAPIGGGGAAAAAPTYAGQHPAASTPKRLERIGMRINTRSSDTSSSHQFDLQAHHSMFCVGTVKKRGKQRFSLRRAPLQIPGQNRSAANNAV